MNDLTAVLVSTAPERNAERRLTAQQLRNLGFEPLIQVAKAGDGRGLSAQGYNAARALAQVPYGHHVLYCEDDIDLDQRIVEVLPEAIALDQPVTFYLPGEQFYPPALLQSMRDGGAVCPHFFRVARMSSWWGSQCVLLPWRHVEQLRHARKYQGEALDTALILNWRGLKKHLYSYYPNLVQHRSPVSLCGIAPHRSISYGQC